jgi:hypothetical protein
VFFWCFCKCLRRMFQCFIYLLFILQVLHMNVSKVDRGVAIRMESERGHKRSPHGL